MAKATAPRTPGKSMKGSAAQGSAKKITKSDKENLEHTPTKKARVTVHWAKADNHHITDTLLTLIEDSVTWKGTFGFDKGVEKDPTPTGKGKSIIQHCADIATVLFAIGKKNSEWTNNDLAHLRGVVKNRVMSLKATYTEYRNKLGETGHGLVVGGCEDELHAGSDIANVYDDIQLKFPWYLRMHALMDVDLTVLGGENSEGENEDEFTSRTPTPMEDDDRPRGSSCPPSSDRAADTPIASSSAKKRRTPQDLIKEVADAERATRLAMSTANARERTARERINSQSAHDTAIAVERLRIEAHDKQAAASCAHELLMLDRQIELARINAGYRAPGPIDPQLQQ
ncbi:hypothetical protein BU15DRAFT_78338 [Melanogaster broomeanus]|nr:hypothetical protein BU15DRAFT_78338 [Melanogaster broomeanus]